MAAAPKLSIVLPCYNPVGNWQQLVLQSFRDIQQAIQQPVELLLVNDGSSKGFNESEARAYFAQEPAIRIISYDQNRGKGYALRQGVQEAMGELVIYTDVDFPYTQASFIAVYNSLLLGHEVAIGVRNADYYTHLPAARVRVSKTLRWFIRTTLRIPTDDTQCGLKGFNAKGREVFLATTIDRYLFDLEFVFMAARKKLKVDKVQVELREGVQLSKMNWQILSQEFGNFLKIFVQSIV